MQTIHVETREEAQALAAIFNHTDNCFNEKSNFAEWINNFYVGPGKVICNQVTYESFYYKLLDNTKADNHQIETPLKASLSVSNKVFEQLKKVCRQPFNNQLLTKNLKRQLYSDDPNKKEIQALIEELEAALNKLKKLI